LKRVADSTFLQITCNGNENDRSPPGGSPVHHEDATERRKSLGLSECEPNSKGYAAFV
jgi:hypothetical protein